MSKSITAAEIAKMKADNQAEINLLIEGVSSDSTKEEIELIISRTNPPLRLSAFIKLKKRLDPNPDWLLSVLTDMWTGQEIFCSTRTPQGDFAQELFAGFIELFAEYQDQLQTTLSLFDPRSVYTLYHGGGYEDYHDIAHCWTLSEKTAKFFAERASRRNRTDNGLILEIQISGDELSNQACFYTNLRTEQEVFFMNDPRDFCALVGYQRHRVLA